MSQLISPSKHHRTLNGVELTKKREALGITQDDFANRCGWSQQYQQQLEAPEEHEISTINADKIERICFPTVNILNPEFELSCTSLSSISEAGMQKRRQEDGITNCKNCKWRHCRCLQEGDMGCPCWQKAEFSRIQLNTC